MCSKVLVLILTTLFLQQVYSLTRVEIRSQYQPTLDRLRDVANVKYQQITREYTALIQQLDKQQTKAKNSTQTLINNIKTISTDAKKTPNITAIAFNCLKNQEAIAYRLTINPLSSCNPASNTSLLNTIKSRFSTLSSVAVNANAYCNSLNPLESQLDTYERCLVDKVPDLNRQINIVENQYHELSNDTLYSNAECLTDRAGGILGQISVISYEINVCFFAPLS